MKGNSSCDNWFFGWIVLVLLTVLTLLPSRAEAQNNPKGVRDELYPLVVECERKMNSPDGIKLANELYEKGVKLGDKSAQGHAMQFQLSYYMIYGKDTTEIMRNMEAIRGRAYKLGFEDPICAIAYWREVGSMALRKHYNRAFEIAKQWYSFMKRSSKRHFVGRYYYYVSMGNLYSELNDKENAKKFYDMAYDDFSSSHDASSNPAFAAEVWLNMAQAYLHNFTDYDKAMQCVDKVATFPLNDGQRQRMYYYKTLVYYYRENFGKDFIASASQYLEIYDKLKAFSKEQEREAMKMRALVHMAKGEYAMAHELADKIPDEYAKAATRSKIYRSEGKWFEAFHALAEQDSIAFESMRKQMEGVRKAHTKDLAELNATLGNDRLRAEKAEISLANSQLALSNSQMKLGNLQLLTEKERTLRANDALRLQNSMKSDSLNKALVTSQAMKMKAMEEEQAHREAEQRARAAIAIFVVLLMLVAAIAALILWRNEKRHVKKLRLRNKQLVIARNEAQESEKMKGIFVENVSHEIRTPLNAIVGFSSLLTTPGMKMSDKDKQEFCATINKNSELLTAMVNDLLALSEMGSTQKLVIADCNVNSMCRNALMTVKHRCPEGVDLLFTSDMADTDTISTDERRVTQVLVNFLTNAEKYTAKGSITLACSARKEEGYVTFTVTDTGCGIPLEKQAKAFDRFEKMGSFTQGIGLGLNICKTTANLMKAKIGIDPTYTDGARFYFAVPLENDKKS